tara:strand:- start:531 stop:1433 length:903 start_codon:yes stop_codon:yes gene_type:complete
MKTLFKIFNYTKEYVLKFWFVEIFKIFSDQKKLHSKILNLLGVQPFRTWIAHKIKERNQRFVIIDMPKNMKAQMEENGYVKIERALKKNQQFFDLRKECKNAFDNHPNRNYVDDKDASYIWINLDSKELKYYPRIKEFLHSDLMELFYNMSIYNQSQRISFNEISINLHRVWTKKGFSRESNQKLHTDIFFPSTKGWLYLDDVKNNEGPLVYVPKSNKIDFWRLKFEYKSSLFSNNDSGSWRITEKELKTQFKNEKILDVKSNTMIIADTMGFHRRGDTIDDKPRDTIHFYIRKSPFKFY